MGSLTHLGGDSTPPFLAVLYSLHHSDLLSPLCAHLLSFPEGGGDGIFSFAFALKWAKINVLNLFTSWPPELNNFNLLTRHSLGGKHHSFFFLWQEDRLAELMKAWNEEYGAAYGQWDMSGYRTAIKEAPKQAFLPNGKVSKKLAGVSEIF